MRPNLYTNQQPKPPEYFHSITTDNEKFINLGLDVFTTGTLYDWLCTKNSGPKRVNFDQIKKEASESDAEEADFYRQRLSGYDHLRFYLNEFSSMFNGGSSNGSLPTEVVLTPDASQRDESCTETDLPFAASFYAWRNDGRNGEYILVKNKGSQQDMDWKFSEGNENYVWNDLRIDEFDGVHYDRNSINLTSPDVFPVVSEDSPKLIRNIIEMNRYVNLLSRVSYKDWKSKDKARHRFIQDIRASKYSCLEWKSNITFLLDLPQVLVEEGINTGGEDCDNCAKKVTVTFKLKLFGGETGRRTGTSVASTDTTIVQTKTTPYGSAYTDKDETGSLPPFVKPNPKNGTAGELSNHFVPLEGKFESGTTQVFAIMTEDLPGSQQPSLDDSLAEDSPFLLNKNTGFEVNVGKAMVVSMQNANPKQWMPDFAKPRNCRDGNNDKVIINVYNPTSRGFVAGENVILQKLDGVWVPLSVGEGSSAIAPADPNWEFMYLMTNSMFFFRNHDWVRKQAGRGNTLLDDFDAIGGKDQTLNTPDNYEQSFYHWYYKTPEETERANNNATADNVSIIDISDNSDRYGHAVSGYARVFNGYMQVTSWDFMGIGVGGTRRNSIDQNNVFKHKFTESEAIAEEYAGDAGLNGNALSTTQFSQDPAGNAFENGGLAGKLNSYPFFGCVFPQGYNGQSKYAELMADDTDFFLAPKNYISSNSLNYVSNGPFFYASNGKPFQNINNLQNIIGNQTNDQTKGMFPDSEAGALKHLPADIGTNSAPGGINGRPISNIGMIGDLNTLLQQNDFRRYVNEYFQNDAVTGQPNRYSWMHKKDRDQVDVVKSSGNAQDFAYDYSDSVFDLEPVNALKIEFRPLSNELYACFEGYNFLGEKEVSLAGSYVYNRRGDDRGELSTRIYQTNKAFSSPLSPLSLYRNTQVTNIPNMLGVTDAGAEGTDKITQNLTLFQNGGTTIYGATDPNANGFRYGPDLDEITLGGPFGHRPQGSSASPQLWFTDNWWGLDQSPSAALGVIGAVVTVATANSLQFITENAVGLDDYLNGGDYFPSYVGGDFSKLNTSQLYARVYQQWPRDQMIYDPRFFVVHHFNDGIDIARSGVNYEWYVNGSPIEGEPTSEQKIEGYPLGAYKVDKSESSVDFRVPTDWDNETLAVNGLVFADSSNGSLNKAVNNGVAKIREKPHWRIQSQRRGRLLPYTYAHITIGIAKNPVIRILTEGDTAAASDVDIVIINGGSKYGKADTFTLSGASGGGVVLKPVLGDDGTVTGFEVSEVGLVFDASDFLNSDDSLTWETGGSPPSGPVSIVHRDVNQGTDLEAYVLRGEITTTKLTDKKPEEALESAGPIKLGPDPPLANDAVLQFQQTDPKNQVLKVNPNAKPKNNQYDVFLHYHNDVSHNRIDEANVPNSIEQMIRLQIQTDGASGGGSSLSSNAQGAGSDIDFPPGGGPDQFQGSDWAFNSNNFGGGFMDGIGDFFGGMG